jgi:hypothetical protein
LIQLNIPWQPVRAAPGPWDPICAAQRRGTPPQPRGDHGPGQKKQKKQKNYVGPMTRTPGGGRQLREPPYRFG